MLGHPHTPTLYYASSLDHQSLDRKKGLHKSRNRTHNTSFLRQILIPHGCTLRSKFYIFVVSLVFASFTSRCTKKIFTSISDRPEFRAKRRVGGGFFFPVNSNWFISLSPALTTILLSRCPMGRQGQIAGRARDKGMCPQKHSNSEKGRRMTTSATQMSLLHLIRLATIKSTFFPLGQFVWRLNFKLVFFAQNVPTGKPRPSVQTLLNAQPRLQKAIITEAVYVHTDTRSSRRYHFFRRIILGFKSDWRTFFSGFNVMSENADSCCCSCCLHHTREQRGMATNQLAVTCQLK